mmetsp:Transcript_13969/g.42129  ORF Transcript_13969/g.42129 Transcript_13969/m.42129 type:complete len:240 (+) Transcript_13969:1443-2162(+)
MKLRQPDFGVAHARAGHLEEAQAVVALPPRSGALGLIGAAHALLVDVIHVQAQKPCAHRDVFVRILVQYGRCLLNVPCHGRRHAIELAAGMPHVLWCPTIRSIAKAPGVGLEPLVLTIREHCPGLHAAHVQVALCAPLSQVSCQSFQIHQDVVIHLEVEAGVKFVGEFAEELEGFAGQIGVGVGAVQPNDVPEPAGLLRHPLLHRVLRLVRSTDDEANDDAVLVLQLLQRLTRGHPRAS